MIRLNGVWMSRGWEVKSWFACVNNVLVFAITAAGVGSCGGPRKSPRTSSIVQIIFFF